ncbi:hypothetical protein LSUE1_G009377 [Lachnellula suecica]|uniref:Uncharacterized protein n=1 Tax=Lachnellula suecica TaxID=602035 RepID=A0A8T9C0T5_9HELO|nr:hypothetical protein LSUE1_G009377 [Lachnellula suecica]
MASTPSLSTPPPEIICRIFECANDFSVVAALFQTARKFYLTWRENPTTICGALAPRVISNLTDAERLLDMQEEAVSKAESLLQKNREPTSIIRAKRLMSNARCASAAADCWIDVLQIHNSPTFDRGEHRGEDPHMRPSEIARFKHAFYCVWTIGVMGKAPHLQSQASAFLDACSPRELCRLEELATWAYNYNDNDFGSLALNLRDEIWMAGYDLVSKRWRAYQDGKRLVGPSDTPMGFFVFFDETQFYLNEIPDQ